MNYEFKRLCSASALENSFPSASALPPTHSAAPTKDYVLLLLQLQIIVHLLLLLFLLHILLLPPQIIFCFCFCSSSYTFCYAPQRLCSASAPYYSSPSASALPPTHAAALPTDYVLFLLLLQLQIIVHLLLLLFLLQL
jgi:hypothetical protein